MKLGGLGHSLLGSLGLLASVLCLLTPRQARMGVLPQPHPQMNVAEHSASGCLSF